MGAWPSEFQIWVLNTFFRSIVTLRSRTTCINRIRAMVFFPLVLQNSSSHNPCESSRLCCSGNYLAVSRNKSSYQEMVREVLDMVIRIKFSVIFSSMINIILYIAIFSYRDVFDCRWILAVKTFIWQYLWKYKCTILMESIRHCKK